MTLLRELEANPIGQHVEMELCKRDAVRWFNNWAWTYDPRAAASKRPSYMPFDLFPRQEELVRWLEERLTQREDGLIEKSRDIGFTWLSGGFALHKWLFYPGFKTTFGSRKEEYVDRIGDPDSIFEKIRMLLANLPPWMKPARFNPNLHDNHMRLLNPMNTNTIRGEAGDQMGRGGRSTVYMVDEAAFIERAERVDAATSANTDVRIWGSTVNGMGNLFARKRFGEMRQDQIFRFHWSDDPRKDQAWAEKKRASLEPHTFASEFDIDYSASVEGICVSAKWVESAKRIGKMLTFPTSSNGIAGLDVGAGKAKSVFVARFGPVVQVPVVWGDPDTVETANRGLDQAVLAKAGVLRFDSVGVGRGVVDALARTSRPGVRTEAVNVGVPPSERQWADGETSKDKFANLKAEAWFLVRERFRMTHEMVLHLEGLDGGVEHPISDLIVLPDDSQGSEAAALASQLSLPRWFRNEKGKVLIEKKEDMSRRGIPSPDHAEALVLTFAETNSYDESMGWV